MLGDRPHRPGRGPDEALAVLRRYGGTQFDPDVVAALAASLEKAKERRARYPRRADPQKNSRSCHTVASPGCEPSPSLGRGASRASSSPRSAGLSSRVITPPPRSRASTKSA